MGDHNTQKMITYNEKHLTVAISDIIISEGLSFNLAQKPSFNKVINLSKTNSKFYQPPNRKPISKDLLDVNNDNLSLIRKDSNIFALLFLGDSATLSRITLLNILVSGGNFQ